MQACAYAVACCVLSLKVALTGSRRACKWEAACRLLNKKSALRMKEAPAAFGLGGRVHTIATRAAKTMGGAMWRLAATLKDGKELVRRQ